MTRRDFLYLAAAAGTLRAETSADRGKQIVNNTIRGLGGDAFLNMRTRTEIGRAYSFYRDKISGLSIARIYTKYLPPAEPKSGDAQLNEVQRQALGKKQEDTVLFMTNGAYEVTYRGAKPLPDEQVTRFLDSTLHDIFYILRERVNEPGMIFDARGADVVENVPVEILDILDGENRTLTVWIHSSTWLPVKQRFRRWDPLIKDWHEEVTSYTRYRDAGGGVMWPHATERDRDGEKVFTMYSDRVTVNETLDDSLFQLPGGIKILTK
jgi:hypothetical protein